VIYGVFLIIFIFLTIGHAGQATYHLAQFSRCAVI
jgi:hypothetical protein